MTGAKTIGCINHPGIDAVGRCRQCSKPVCRECGIAGINGMYCSELCREKHEQFMTRAQQLDFDPGAKKGVFFHIRRLLGGLITIVAILFALGVIGSLIEIPFLTDITLRIRSFLGF